MLIKIKKISVINVELNHDAQGPRVNNKLHLKDSKKDLENKSI